MSDQAGDDEPVVLRHGVERFLRHLGAPPPDVLSGLTERWPDIVGPGLAGSTRPVELIDGVLLVGCDDAAWAAQIGWMEGQIRSRFTELFSTADLVRVVARVQALSTR